MSSTSEDSQQPTRILHRAANLLTSTGQPTTAVQEVVLGPVPRVSHRRRLSEGGIAASIKRSLFSVPRGLGLTRSKSTTTPPSPAGHRRANSERPHARAILPHSQSAPPGTAMDDMQRQRSSDLKSHTLHEEPGPNTPEQPPPSSDEVKVPALLLQGTPLLKVSAKKIQTRIFRLDPDQGQILWESKKSGVSACTFLLALPIYAPTLSF